MLHELQPRSPEETRNRILAATRQLFAKKGRRGTTTREIAELAGVNEATLFRHFGSKEALIDACAQHYCAAVALEELTASLDGDLHADLRRLANALMERMEQVRDLIVMSLVEEETDSAVGNAAWSAPSAIRQIVADYMAKRVESGDLAGDPLMLARFFMGMIFAHVVGRKKFPDVQHSTDEILDFQINTFLNGVRKK
jgi:AcrR family transcriptional regulator